MAPVILPPLAATVHIDIPALSPTALLTFTASDVHISNDDKLEIWTDAPGADGWRAVQFDKIVVEDKVEAAAADSSLPEFKIGDFGASIETDGGITYKCQISIPAQACSFGYTYRISYASGHVDWLGYDGGNGSVVLETGKEMGLLLGSGIVEWDGKELDLIRQDDAESWKGFGVQIVNGNTPNLVTLPTPDSKPLVFAHLVPSALSPPFYTPTPSSGITLIADANSTLSLATVTKPTLSSLVSLPPSAVITLGGPSKAAAVLEKGKQGLQLLDLGEGEGSKGVWGFTFMGSAGNRPSHLLFANTLLASRTGITVPIPSSAFAPEEGKLVVWDHVSGKGLIATSSQAKFSLSLAARASAILSLLSVASVPGSTVLVATLAAGVTSQLIEGETKEETYVAEEQVPAPNSSIDDAGLFSDTEASTGTDIGGLDQGMSVESLTSVEAEDDATVVKSNKAGADVVEEVEEVEGDEEEEDDDDDEESDAEGDEGPTTASDKGNFLQAIWSFLKSFWIKSGLAWLFGRRTAKSETPELEEGEWREAPAEVDDDDVIEEAGERTPLLSGTTTKVNTPYLPKATKLSITEPVSPIKSRAMAKSTAAPTYTTVQTTKTRTVQVAPYLKYTMSTAPPFAFVVAGGLSGLKYAARSNGAEWKEISVTNKTVAGEGLETIEVGVLGDGKDWEVKISGA